MAIIEALNFQLRRMHYSLSVDKFAFLAFHLSALTVKFTEAKHYHAKLVTIRKEMLLLHEKTSKLKVSGPASFLTPLNTHPSQYLFALLYFMYSKIRTHAPLSPFKNEVPCLLHQSLG